MPISEVYNCDCLEHMKSLPDKYFDLCIADPPYGINAANMRMGTGRREWTRKEWDRQVPDSDTFAQIFRVSKNAIIWGGNYFDLPLTGSWIVWDKMNPDLSFAEGELAWCSIKKKLRIFKYPTMNQGARIHPAQKPVALYAWLLDKYAIGGGKIFDPFLGSGSSRIAAYKKGFDFYACELDKDYYEAQEKRFRRECLGEVVNTNGIKIVSQTLF